MANKETFLNRKQAAIEFQSRIDDLIARKKIFVLVEQALVGAADLVKTQEGSDALHRLVHDQRAQDSWRKLFSKTSKQSSFYSVATHIGRSAVFFIQMDPSNKKTAKQIESAGKKAAKLAEALHSLISDHATLRTHGIDLMHPEELAALDRILNGIKLLGVKFSPDVESSLNEIQARDHLRYRGMTTLDAYRNLWRTQYRDDSFLRQLERFAKLARGPGRRKPLVPNPGAGNSDAHVFSQAVSRLLDDVYKSPCHEIVAGFASAIFEREIDGQIVKKWWQRRN